MSKKKKSRKILIITLVSLIILGSLIYLGKFFSIEPAVPDDDYVLYADQDNPVSCIATVSGDDCTYDGVGEPPCFNTDFCEFPKWIATSQLEAYELGSPIKDFSRIFGTELNMTLCSTTYRGHPATLLSKDSFKGKYFRTNFYIQATTLERVTNFQLFYVSGVHSQPGEFDKSIPIFSTSITGQDAFPSTRSDYGLISLEPSFADKNIVRFYYKGLYVNSINISSLPDNDTRIYIKVTGGAYDISCARIEKPRFEYEFGCQFEPDEVVVHDSFLGPGNVNITMLNAPIEQFCTDEYPAILRNFTAGIKQDIRGDVTKTFARYENFYVPDGLELVVHYITDFREGIAERCPIGKSWSIKNKTCQQVVYEAPDIIEVIRDTKYITISTNQTSFSNSIDIGKLKITSSGLSYNCDKTTGYTAPQPKNECWTTSANYNNNNYNFGFSEQEIDLDNTFKLQFFAEGRWDEGAQSLKDSNTNFVLTLKNRDFLTITPITKKDLITDFFILHNTPKKLEFTIKNNLTNFTNLQSGFNIKKTKMLMFSQSILEEQKDLLVGETNYSIDVDTSELGEIIYEITPYIKIGNMKFTDNQAIVYNYKVVIELPDNVVVVNNTIFLNQTVTIKEYIDRNVTILVNATAKNDTVLINETKKDECVKATLAKGFALTEVEQECEDEKVLPQIFGKYTTAGYIIIGVVIVFVILITFRNVLKRRR